MPQTSLTFSSQLRKSISRAAFVPFFGTRFASTRMYEASLPVGDSSMAQSPWLFHTKRRVQNKSSGGACFLSAPRPDHSRSVSPG